MRADIREGFRAIANDGPPYLAQVSADAIVRLFQAPGMDAPWERIAARLENAGLNVTAVLWGIARAAHKASIVPGRKNTVIAAEEHYTDLKRATLILEKHFAAFGDLSEAVELRRSLAWAAEMLDAMSSALQKSIANDLPQSQNKSEKVAFGKLLCSEMTDILGSPLYSFVVAVSNAIYPDAKKATEEGVQRAYRGESDARNLGSK